MYLKSARRKSFVALLGVVGMTSLASVANAGGFALIEHGASGLGNAYAGAAAVSTDTSTVWFNPAGMSQLEDREVAAALHILTADTTFTDEGSRLGFRLGGAEVSGPDASGIYFYQLSNHASTLARVLGLQQIDATSSTGGLVRFSAGNHGSILDPTEAPAVTVEMQTQTASFAASQGTVLPITDSTSIESIGQ